MSPNLKVFNLKFKTFKIKFIFKILKFYAYTYFNFRCLEVFYKPSCFQKAVAVFDIADLLVPFTKQTTTAPVSVRAGGSKRSGSKNRNVSKSLEEKKSPKASKQMSKKPADEKKIQDLSTAYNSYQLSQTQQYLCFYLCILLIGVTIKIKCLIIKI